jgi:hypothetical protein
MSHHPYRPRPASPTRPLRVVGTPIWDPVMPDQDLVEAANETSHVAAWLNALADLGETTMRDHEIEFRYSQARDALHQMGVEQTTAAIEAWVHQNRPT